jgi:hypothetical protein
VSDIDSKIESKLKLLVEKSGKSDLRDGLFSILDDGSQMGDKYCMLSEFLQVYQDNKQEHLHFIPDAKSTAARSRKGGGTVKSEMSTYNPVGSVRTGATAKSKKPPVRNIH